MGRFAVIAAVVLLGCIHLSAAGIDFCDFYAVGQSLTLSFDLTHVLTSGEGLKWTHNGTAVYLRQPSGTVIHGKAEDVSPTGSLLLKNLQFSSAGIYEGTLLHPNYRETKIFSNHVCVVDAVSKPQLTYVCDFKSGAVVLNCNVPSPQALVFSWMLGKSVLQKETRQTLTLPLERLKGGSVMCAVENKASKAISDAVLPLCKSPTPPPPPVCLPLKTFGAVLAGGGGLVLVLLIVIIVLCCRHKRPKDQMRSGNKVELRLASVNNQELGTIGPDYETMHATEDYACPGPRPSSRACKKSGSEFEGEAENKASPAEGEQKPSPVPKPRTRLIQTADV